MNVIAKSINLTPFLRATTKAVPNGPKSSVTTGKVQKTKIILSPPLHKIFTKSYTINGPIRLSSGIAGISRKILFCVIMYVYVLRNYHSNVGEYRVN